MRHMSVKERRVVKYIRQRGGVAASAEIQGCQRGRLVCDV